MKFLVDVVLYTIMSKAEMSMDKVLNDSAKKEGVWEKASVECCLWSSWKVSGYPFYAS